MRTDDLIKALAADAATRQPTPARALGPALIMGFAIAGLAFFAAIGMRADIAEAVATWRFQFKFALTVLLALSAIPALLALSRPTPASSSQLAPLALAPLALLTGLAIEMMTAPASTWPARLIGHNVQHCLTIIPLLALAPLATAIYALRHGAPANPARTGAVAGILSGALAAMYYATSCIDDSPLFIATWYTIAIAIVAAAGALAGRKTLKW